jgi:serine/threonine protein kinase
VLIDGSGSARITDFGLTLIGETTIGRATTVDGNAGTFRWMSPERLDAEPGSRRMTPGDVYAFGLLCVVVSYIRVPSSIKC